MKKRAQCNVRLEPDNEKRLELAVENGLTATELVNGLLRDYFKPFLESRSKKLAQLAASN